MNSNPRWVLALTSVASLMVGLDILVVTTALTTIHLKLGASLGELEWIINAYTLSFAVLLMTASALGDRFGRRRLFLAGLGLFTVMSAACALAPSIGWLIAARAVQGVGSAMIMPHAMALLSAAYAPEKRAKALGIFSSVTGLAVLGGPMIGGVVVQGLDWPWIFWLNVPIGLVLIPLAARKIGESRGRAARFDAGGVVLATVSALGLVWSLVRGNTAGWTSPEVLGALAGGVAALAGFIAWERRAPEPMLPLRLFRSRAFTAGNAAGFGMYAGIFGAAFFLAQLLQLDWHYGPLGAGLRLAPWTVTLTLVAPVAGALVPRIGERPLIAAGLTLQAAGFVWVALVVREQLGYAAIVAPLVLAGCGVSLAMPAAQNCVIGAVPAADLGKASGTFNTLRQLGGTFGIAILAAVFSGAGSYASARTFGAGFVPTAEVAAGLSLAGAVAGALVPSRRRPPADPARVATPAPDLRTMSETKS
ncbi:MAG TPA: DHA2 family efflux MFS transporter permease subunit [Streptosporangiaceae bacterium]